MPGIAEPHKRINPARDYPISFPCGCRVVFLGSCLHRSTRMECCAGHSARDNWRERDEIQRRAKEEYGLRELLQPPT